MTLVPESIKATNTKALDLTFKRRIVNLNPDQLRIDIENERDLVKLGLWLEQFGIPMEFLPTDLEKFAFRELLQQVLKIYRFSGTTVSVSLLAKALQAEVVEVEKSYSICYDGQARYNGLFWHDDGQEYVSFAIDVHISGVLEERKAEFESLFRKLFQVFEPVGVFLRDVNFEGVFDSTFYSTFN